MDTPAILKPIKPYLTHAAQISKYDQLMSYHCKAYAVELGVKLMKSQAQAPPPEVKTFLISLLDQLEKEKAALGPRLDKEEGKAPYVHAFATKVFDQADAEDRAGKATKATAKTFYSATIFINTYKQFSGELPEDLEAKLKYAKWKAADITTALREGRAPVPGPAATSDDALMDELNKLGTGVGGGNLSAPIQQVTSGESDPMIVQPSIIAPQFNNPIEPHNISSSFANHPSVPLSQPSAQINHYNGSDDLIQMQKQIEEQKQFMLLQQQRHELQMQQMQAQMHKPSPSAPNLPTTSANITKTPAQPNLSWVPVYDNLGVKPETIEDAQRHAKYAVSALTFDDVPTAVKELRAALQILEAHIRT